MIKPFYEEPSITIYCGRAEEVLHAMPDRSFGTLLLDPPYTPPTDKLMEMAKWLKAESRVIVLNRDSYMVIPGKLGWIGRQDLMPMQTFIHPAMRSVYTICDLLKESPSDPIIDPYMGTGTTLVAAKMLGREAVGIEMDQGFCSAAVGRLNQI